MSVPRAEVKQITAHILTDYSQLQSYYIVGIHFSHLTYFRLPAALTAYSSSSGTDKFIFNSSIHRLNSFYILSSILPVIYNHTCCLVVNSSKMSSQPSTIDSLKSTASSAYETVANSVSATSQNGEYDPDQDKNFVGKDSHGNKFRKGDYKDKLNQAALGGPPEKEESLTEKGISTLQKSTLEQGPEDRTVKDNGLPPTRPEHDVPIEQFLRKQYHSRSGDGIPNPGESN
ncbi:hypothetical protein EYC84_004175 [Monilinia fructicola]|uniref:Uncharacterized protein n=1 Tax=Monilinia fructicola TaxID=38448 RepID=A0A5M9K1Z0_MONFR|nr:hypothetical protein EYC84_004175 [Monilinia fructicola]